jgi:DNA-binding SARP family transcriptional activator
MQHVPSAMLNLTLLGQPAVKGNGVTADLFRGQTRVRFNRLAVRPISLARAPVCFFFWPDVIAARVRRNLTRLLAQLRRTLPALIDWQPHPTRSGWTRRVSMPIQSDTNDLVRGRTGSPSPKSCGGPFIW